jgi:hypothetical protein
MASSMSRTRPDTRFPAALPSMALSQPVQSPMVWLGLGVGSYMRIVFDRHVEVSGAAMGNARDRGSCTTARPSRGSCRSTRTTCRSVAGTLHSWGWSGLLGVAQSHITAAAPMARCIVLSARIISHTAIHGGRDSW